jgi:Amylo-alpha-1,6-glucosidase/N-terminal domain of (some) glycogen debranching enzymes
LAGAKEDELYVMLPAAGGTGWGVAGVFFRDTSYFSPWDWDVGGAQRLAQFASGNQIKERYALTQEDRSQAVGLRRQLTVTPTGFGDRWDLTNTTDKLQTVTLRLNARPRLIDIFAANRDPTFEPEIAQDRISPQSISFTRIAEDGVVHRATLSCAAGLSDDMAWTFALAPGAVQKLLLDVRIDSSDYDAAALAPLPGYEDWRAGFSAIAGQHAAVDQAVDDLRTLLLQTEHGPYPAAGMPIFVNFFGRDALITGLMILDWQPQILRSVLGFLAARQGQVTDSFREEEPGKILHEVRRGELSRTDRIPFGRYYGSVDSTPLFLMAAGAYFAAQGDEDFAAQLRPAIEAATDWLTRHLDGPSGLATFSASGSGLVVQSWKDSANSMLDEHGQPAAQPLAVAEVQGYAYAALLAAACLLPERADELNDRAAKLRAAFHAQFWLPELATYAMALDAQMKPLRVLSSDPGHLLWTGIVPEDIAPILVKTMLGAALWSGWGLRTLGANAVAYNPVSYHNGSVWPHDTGLFAMGLARYGFAAELQMVAQALLDLAAASPGRHMPELISGYDRVDDPEPVSYTHANAPQAWSAATVVRMAAYLAALPSGIHHRGQPA